jgi:hypothetical protein
MSDDVQRIDRETDAEFAARLREIAHRLRRAWGAEEKRERLLERANRIERGEES